ncbi:unnamed protein product, partial [Protopolystoma xenopodis]
MTEVIGARSFVFCSQKIGSPHKPATLSSASKGHHKAEVSPVSATPSVGTKTHQRQQPQQPPKKRPLSGCHAQPSSLQSDALAEQRQEEPQKPLQPEVPDCGVSAAQPHQPPSREGEEETKQEQAPLKPARPFQTVDNPLSGTAAASCLVSRSPRQLSPTSSSLDSPGRRWADAPTNRIFSDVGICSPGSPSSDRLSPFASSVESLAASRPAASNLPILVSPGLKASASSLAQ